VAPWKKILPTPIVVGQPLNFHEAVTRSDQDANQMRMNTMHVAAEKVKSKHFHGE